MSETA